MPYLTHEKDLVQICERKRREARTCPTTECANHIVGTAGGTGTSCHRVAVARYFLCHEQALANNLGDTGNRLGSKLLSANSWHTGTRIYARRSTIWVNNRGKLQYLG